MHTRTLLPNGLRVVSQKIPGMKSVSVGLFIGTGSRYEPAKISGISHFIEHMLFKGTVCRYKPQMISEEIESIGGILNASTDKEITIYYTKTSKDYFDRSLSVLTDMISNPLFDAKEIERERNVILEELSMTYDQPDALADLLIDQALWPGQAIGRDVGGTRESVNSITREDLIDYHRSQYIPSNIVVSVAGDIDHIYLVDQVDRAIDITDHARKYHIEPLQLETKKSIRVEMSEKLTDQTHFCLAFNGVASDSEDSYALDMLSTVLGEGMTSRLFLEIREKLGLAYDVHSSSMHYHDCGATVIGCGTDSTNAEATLSAILNELGKLNKGISGRELSRAVEYSIGRLQLRMEDSRAVMIWLGAQEILKNRIDTVEDVELKLRSITTDDLVLSAIKYTDVSNARLSVVGPHNTKYPFEQILANA